MQAKAVIGRAASPLALLAAVALAGCGLGAGRAPSAVELSVTRDFGASPLPRSGALKISGQETAMSLLRRNHGVQTRYGGAFVQSVDGLAGGEEAGKPVDWFYYVNGVEASKGAASSNVDPGDHIWWDRHDWSQTGYIPAVVGSFPEPFLNGIGGKRLPVRIECAVVRGYACRTVAERLHALDIPAARAGVGIGGATATLRLLVGRWEQVVGDLDARRIADGPRMSGVYARFSADGHTLTLLDQDGHAVRALSAGAGLVAATRRAENAPVWVITGTDDAGMNLAARAFDQSTLRDHFAVALAAGETVALPARVTKP
ncbi:MAG TPA: DUF4430 domain-containing protein [Solirubrobacteraceae bacterium]|nr:DUF4430 domain-containing protein [Solirubrobacteraceae bacterium]